MTHGNQCVEITEWSRIDDINRYLNAILLHKAYPVATELAYREIVKGKQMSTMIPAGYCDNCKPDWIKQQEKGGLE